LSEVGQLHNVRLSVVFFSQTVTLVSAIVLFVYYSISYPSLAQRMKT